MSSRSGSRIVRYLVSGQRAFRGHAPGSEFEAVLDPLNEGRALRRGDIEVLERFIPTLQPGSFTLPTGWANPRKEN